ncbi:MAG: NTP transferase domain-containing protein [Deltaproteobacteria bacterium]|nr:NTP transferase domain-containing protein [Deltaproteobacteria bacterium]
MANTKGEVAVIILAAGLGTRMKSSKAKVLHEILDRPMVMYVVDVAEKIAGDNVILVIGNQAEKVRKVVSEQTNVLFALQEEQLGTGHAVLCAIPQVPSHVREVVILCGDVPLLTEKTLTGLFEDHAKADRDISLLAVEIENPKGYGRIIINKNKYIEGIVEEADASEEQKRLKIVNTGIYCIKKEILLDYMKEITSDNVKGEFYLTDIVEIGYRNKSTMGVLVGDDWKETVGVNTQQDLMTAENIMRDRMRIMS